MSEKALCPCGSGKTFSDCCEIYISGQSVAPTPEALMRSRFSAFYFGNAGQYLLDTWHPETRPELSAEALEKESQQGRWEKLEVRDSHMDGDKGEVTFCAWYRDQQGLHPHLERSQFVRLIEGWVYTTGEFLPYTKAKKLKPNDPCSCGSGKKYKKCCG